MTWRQPQGTWKRRTEFWRARMRSLALARFGGPRRGAAPLEGARNATAMSSWDEAFSRVESYLRAHHVESRVQLNALATGVIAEAQRIAAERPGEDPVQLSMHVLHLRLGRWFAEMFGEGDWADERFRARARLALLQSGLMKSQPQILLSPDALATARAAVQAAHLESGPEVRLSNMPPAPLEFPFGDEQAPPWRAASGWMAARAAVSWILMAGLLGAVTWAASRSS